MNRFAVLCLEPDALMIGLQDCVSLWKELEVAFISRASRTGDMLVRRSPSCLPLS